jgi:hypothetical protein
MFLRSVNPLVRAVSGTAFAIALTILPFAHQGHAAEGPFANMTGNWSGPGTITVNNNKERLRCRAGYNVSNNGSTVDLQIRCASDSYKFDLQGGVNNNNGVLSGTWSESAHGAAGEIAGTVSGGVIRARATGPYFSAHLSLSTRGNSQSISLNAPGSQISSVSITLNKGGATAAR